MNEKNLLDIENKVKKLPDSVKKLKLLKEIEEKKKKFISK